MWLPTLAACDQVEAPPAEPAAPSAWVYARDTGTPAVDPAVVGADVQRIVDTLPTVHAAPVLSAWAQARAYGDAACPQEDVADSATDGHTVYFDDICLAGATWFKGPMTTFTFTDNTLAEGSLAGEIAPMRADPMVAWTGSAVRGQVDVYDESGTIDFNCSCTALTGTATTAEGTHWFSYVDGPAHWTAPEAPAAWFDEGLQAQLYTYAQHAADGTLRVVAEGTLTGAETAYGSIWLRLRLTRPPGAACETDEFKVVLRDATGERFSVNFSATGEDCRFCGTVADGELCVDAAALADEAASW